MAEPAFMETGIGHNRGPVLPAESTIDLYLETEYADNVTRANDLLAAESRFINVSSDDADSEATEFMVKVRTAWKTAEAGRVKEKAPFDDLAGRIHAFFKTRALDPLEAMGKRINEAQTNYKLGVLRAKQETDAENLRKQRAAEKAAADKALADRLEAERLALAAARARKPETVAALTQQAEQAAAVSEQSTMVASRAAEDRHEVQQAAAVPAADVTRARGGRGGVSSLRGTTSFRDLDSATIDLEVLRGHFPPAAFDQAMNSWIKANKGAADKAAASNDAKDQPIKGVVIYTSYSNVGRR